MLKKWLVFGIVLSVSAAAACGGDTKAPVAPSPGPVVDADAAADGSTLKVTAPAIFVPAGGATLDTTVPNLVVTPASGKFVSAGALVYRFSVQTAGGSEVYRSGTVADPGTGLIAQRVPEGTLAWATSYRWTARAEQGTLIGPWMAFAAFQTPPEPAAPTLDSPKDGGNAGWLAPELKVVNGGLPAGSSTTGFEHRFVVETTTGTVMVTGTAPSGTTKTSFTVPKDTLQQFTTYRWRARAERGSAFVGPWSPYWTFVTASSVIWPTTPQGIVNFVAERHPEYLRATATLHQREENMKFIRDRMIEAGICGGLDLAWNLKRGVGPHSTDALLHRDTSGGRTRDRVIDIAAGFDEYKSPLSLHWIEVVGPPGYDRYLPRPTCQ